MRRYLGDVVPVTDDEGLISFAAVYDSMPVPDYSTAGAGSSAEASDIECNRLEWLKLHERGRVVTWCD